jgi:two-component system, OmpR family, alkaline phosphatase synthesis response regulator PhoP
LTPTPILLVSDDPALVQSVSQPLASAGYRVIHMTSGAAVLQHVQAHPPELVMVHVSPGGTEEVQLCQRLKHDLLTAPVPVVLLIDSSEEAALIVGLAMGVDDYLIRPFSARLLLALVQAVLRRQPRLQSGASSGFTAGALHIHTSRYEVHVNNRQVALTPTEFRILSLLAQHPEQTWNRQQIVATVRGDQANVTLRSVDAHIAALRRKLGPYGHRIKTVRGIGYQLHSAE